MARYLLQNRLVSYQWYHIFEMHKDKKKIPLKKKSLRKQALFFVVGVVLGGVLLIIGGVWFFTTSYENRVYPGISIANHPFGGASKEEIIEFWLTRNAPFQKISATFQFETHVATLSANQLDIGFDATLSATQAMSVGRSPQFLTNIYHVYIALTQGIDLKPLFRWKDEALQTTLDSVAQEINMEPENALFEFQNGRVYAFKLSKPGRVVDVVTAKKRFVDTLELLAADTSPTTQLTFALPVIPKEPLITTELANDLGIVELIGRGESYFRGSIAGRIHNVALGASRINGVIIAPGETFSFNTAVGDISAATGYKQAYVIKSGRTVLDDGGGICQVSTTLFRAALNAGLPIVERHAHSYRVGYYEQNSKPGFDATVYAPSYDLKIKNDTGTSILIQATTDTAKTHLTFTLYGKGDNRKVELSPVRLWDSKPAPPDLYQDDPTLPTGTVKQVDWANPGIKAAFDYKVTRNGEELFRQTFFSNFIPWQAVYLRGTGPK